MQAPRVNCIYYYLTYSQEEPRLTGLHPTPSGSEKSTLGISIQFEEK